MKDKNIDKPSILVLLTQLFYSWLFRLFQDILRLFIMNKYLIQWDFELLDIKSTFWNKYQYESYVVDNWALFNCPALMCKFQ